MYGKPFNVKRPFGVVHGSSLYAFEQDGQLFNVSKQPVDENGKLMPLEPRNEAPPEPEPGPVALAGDPDDDIPEDEKPFDLHAWAMGDEKLAATPYATVRAAAATVIEDMSSLKSKDALRKALLAHYQTA